MVWYKEISFLQLIVECSGEAFSSETMKDNRVAILRRLLNARSKMMSEKEKEIFVRMFRRYHDKFIHFKM